VKYTVIRDAKNYPWRRRRTGRLARAQDREGRVVELVASSGAAGRAEEVHALPEGRPPIDDVPIVDKP